MIVYMYSNLRNCCIPCGIHLESTIIPSFHVELDGIYLESSGIVMEYPSDSMWIPHRYSIWNGGIVVESHDSIWIPGGIE
jgi:hypothetical protein